MTLYIVIALIPAVVLIACTVQRRWQRLRAIGSGLLISYMTILILVGVGEVFLSCCYASPSGRLASNNWQDRYWHTNSLGFRDREWSQTDFDAATTIALIGDSFTAGWGIENPADRFGDVLARRLPDDQAVFNLGVVGSSTPEQLVVLQQFVADAVTPDVVILQYFLNDIDYAALTLGLPTPTENLPLIARQSHLANFLYSRGNVGFGVEYWQQEYANYDNYVIWTVHEAELNALIDYVESINARLIVVIFPNLQDPVGSIAYVDRVAQVFTARDQHAVLKLFDAAAAWDRADLIVSPLDAHPSRAFQRYVGETLYTQFFAP